MPMALVNGDAGADGVPFGNGVPRSGTGYSTP